MVQVEFSMLVGKLAAFYERKKPNDGTMDLWFDVISAIPPDEIDDIFDRIVKENDSFPRNLTGTMWAIHYELRAARGIADAEKVYDECDYCNHGLIFLQKKNEGCDYYVREVFRCSHCKRRKEAYPWGNIEILLMHGYEEYPLLEGSFKVTNMKELMEFVAGWIARKTIPDIEPLPF